MKSCPSCRTTVEASVAMGHFDINKICEDVFCELFKLEVDLGAKPGVTTDQSKRMKELKREFRKP